MTDTSTDTATTDVPDHLSDGPLSTRQFVARQVGILQRQYLPPDQTPWSRAALAELRRHLGQPLGASPQVLALVVNPTARVYGDAETADERAIATALGLYAVHQQSQSVPMHVPGTSFGAAVGAIRFRDGDEVRGVTRRFQAFGTAQAWDELVHHARGLVQLLRDRRQGFDYARFAEDLALYQHPAHQDAVRLRWGRAFYRVTATPTSPTTASAEEQ